MNHMTVGQLKKLLRSFHNDSVVVIKDHDQSEDECNGTVKFVHEESDTPITDQYGGNTVVVLQA